MHTTELARYKAMLESQQAERKRGLPKRSSITFEKTADVLDEAQLTGERELVVRNLHYDSDLLGDIRDALGRITRGAYGVCLSCEEEINPKRLAALPWAAYCVRCQASEECERLAA
jgi:DnaK suppressor protein